MDKVTKEGGGISMAKMAAKHLHHSPWMLKSLRTLPCTSIRASQSMDADTKFFKQLGLFALRKKIDDVVIRAEMLMPAALNHEETRHIRREEMIRDYNLWDDPVKANEILAKLADSAKAVNALKDLKYKAEEAKLITELAETDTINYRLFMQAYDASVDVSKFLDWYEMLKLMSGKHDMHGAVLVVKAGEKGIYSERWAEQLVMMYMKWAEKLGHKGRIIERCFSKSGGIKAATIEFEFEYAYGYLMGERGVHRIVGNLDTSTLQEENLAAVDVIPLFFDMPSDLPLDDEDLVISCKSSSEYERGPAKTVVHIQHLPTGICVQSSGERSEFANKLKALNRLKAKLLVLVSEQGVASVSGIETEAIVDMWKQDTRRYIFQPHKLVHDLKTGLQLPDLNSVLNGNLELLIGAHVNLRHSNEKIFGY